jgi:hypothetical protein
MGMGSELMCESGDWRLWDGGVKKYTQTLNIKRVFLYNAAFQQVLLSGTCSRLYIQLDGSHQNRAGKRRSQLRLLTPINRPHSPTSLHHQTAQTIHSSPSPSPKQFPFSSSISKPITKTTPSLAPQLAHTVCCTPQFR